jgi:hypothetical protein
MSSGYTGYLVVRLAPDVSLSTEAAADMHDLSALSRLAGFEPLAAALEQSGRPDTARLITTLTPADSLALEARARERGSIPRGSITSYWRVDARHVPDADELARRLRELPQVELVYRETSGSDPSVVAANDPLAVTQRYLDPPPHGINARWMWEQPHGTGTSVRFVDLEQGWLFNHEDLPVLTALFNVPREVNPSSVNHGTGVLGIVAAVDNDRGIVGIAPALRSISVASHFRPWTSSSGHVADAIQAVLPHLDAGDVLLIEWQTDDQMPAEADPAVWRLIRTASESGIIVVEAGGNGDLDLDNFAEFNPRDADSDSGAMIVGACHAALNRNGGHDRWLDSRVPPPIRRASNHGARIDCHAAGEHVVTLGATPAGPTSPPPVPKIDDYRADFGGTSAAAAIVAGAAALLQGMCKGVKNAPISPAVLRGLFRTLGTPQGMGRPGNIGVMPDLRKAAESLGLV